MLSSKSPAPPTPRSIRATYAISTPSRVQVQAPFQPIAPLPHRPYPTLTTNLWRDQAYDQLQQTDMEAADFALLTMRQANERLKRDFASVLAEVADAKKRAESEAKMLGHEAKDLSQLILREKAELAEAERKQEDVGGTRRNVQQRFESCRIDLIEAEASLMAKRAKKQQQRLELSRQAALNTSELALFQEKVGLIIRSRGSDLVQFKFMNVDPGNFKRTFACDVDVSKPMYSIPTISPENFLPPDIINPIVNSLNQTRDFNLAVRTIRKAFVNQVALEKSGEKDRGSKTSGTKRSVAV